ncbi:CDP-archaeol synthase [Thermomicrobium sp. 4228-Ro]|uniref:phosphatidate cytidylyltransferase n=1 Tax=Thermomicrobium sp. 4228-Ro TaxID=2993937 RepID=UPI00224886EB|nr:CDP-archaeol synthase [Thermomicrobium sp. 4228-Ro]MCX2727714.1 CDP-archaeol synthase [Thermomicrobium sp. 4228-Ro]
MTVVPLALGPYPWLMLLLSVLLLGARELAAGLGHLVERPLSVPSIVLAGSVPILLAASPLPETLFPAAVSLSIFLPFAWHTWGTEFRHGMQAGTLAAFAATYLGIPLAASQVLRAMEGRPSALWITTIADLTGSSTTALGLAWLAWALAVTWFTDIAAYLVGRRFGRRKLAPRVSPGKTWEGAVAGCVTGLVIGLATGMLFGLPLSPWASAAFGVIIALLAELGDLAESYMKRAAGIKDFGTLLPGHGGVVDRIDALLVTIPATLLLATLLTGGN